MNSITFAKAIADSTRQRIMHMLCCEWLCVGEIVSELGNVSQPTVSHHLSILKDASLVTTRRNGKKVLYRLNQQEIALCCHALVEKFAPETSLHEQ